MRAGSKSARDYIFDKAADFDLAHPFEDTRYLQLTDKQKQKELEHEWEQRAKRFSHGSTIKPVPNYIHEQELEKLTTPNMRGFFPEETAGKKGKILTFFDTETDDYGRILTIAAYKVRFNFSKLRFENVAGDSGFFRVYNPSNVDTSIARTKSKHGLSSRILSRFRKDSNVTYSSNWDLSQYEAFQQYIGDTEVAGHNIVAADIPWIMRPTGRDFNTNTYRKGFFDTLHYAKAIRGKESAGLQNLASLYNITPASLGLHAHEAASDVITNIKVLENLIKTNIGNPYTAEALYALGLKGVQTHYKETLNLAEGIGAIIEGARGKPLYNLPYKGAKQAFGKYKLDITKLMNATQVLDVGEAFDIPQDVYDNARSTSGYIGDNYTEEQLAPLDEALMEDYKPLKTFMERMDRLYKELQPAAPSGNFDKDSLRIIRALKPLVSKTGAGLESPILDISESVDSWLDVQLRGTGYTNPNADLKQRYVRRALQENAADYWKKQVQLNEEAANLIAKDEKRYGFAGQGLSWFDRLAGLSEEDVSRAEIDIYKESKKEFFRQQKEQQALAKAEQKEIQKQTEDMWKAYTLETPIREQTEAMYAQREAERELGFEGTNVQEQHAWEYHKQYLKEEAARKEKEQQALADFRNEARTLAWDTSEAERISRFSSGLENRLNKQEYLNKNKRMLFGSQYAELSAQITDKMTESLEEYTEQVEKTIESNKTATKVMTGMYHATKPFYNFVGLMSSAQSEVGEIGSAIGGIVPSVFRPAVHRSTLALQQFMGADIAQANYVNNMARNIGHTLSGAGAGLSLLPVPGAGVAGGILAAAGTGVNLVSNYIGEKTERDITKAGKLLAGRINLLSASLSMLTAPLNMFRLGLSTSINLFKRLGSLWSIQYGMPLTHLTGISSSHYSAMLSTDRLMGNEAGTANAMHNAFAMGQAGLYTSGVFDEKRLVAAARLGVFDTVYAPMGGDTEAQFASTADRLAARLRTARASGDKRTEQEIMYLAADIDKNLPNVLQRMNTLGVSSYASLQNGSYVHGTLGVHGRDMTGAENVAWTKTSTAWGASLQYLQMGAKRIAQPLWERVGRPVMNSIIDAVDEVAGLMSDPKGISWDKLKDVGKNLWESIKKNFGVEGDLDLGGLWEDATKKLKSLLPENFGSMLLDILLKGLDWVGQQEAKILEHLKEPITKALNYLNSIDFDIDWLAVFGWKDGKKVTFRDMYSDWDKNISASEDARVAATRFVKNGIAKGAVRTFGSDRGYINSSYEDIKRDYVWTNLLGNGNSANEDLKRLGLKAGSNFNAGNAEEAYVAWKALQPLHDKYQMSEMLRKGELPHLKEWIQKGIFTLDADTLGAELMDLLKNILSVTPKTLDAAFGGEAGKSKEVSVNVQVMNSSYGSGDDDWIRSRVQAALTYLG